MTRGDKRLSLVVQLRHDTFLTKLGDRSDRGCSRLWIEDSAGRLSRNGFQTGCGFELTPRAGLGFLLRPSLLASTHVSSRGRAAILSYESNRLPAMLHDTPEARVRVSVNTIVVMPALRLFAIASQRTAAVWRIAGDFLLRPEGMQSVATRVPARFDTTPARLEVGLTEDNLVFATEIVAHAKPESVNLTGSEALRALAGQFLAATGYGLTPAGDYCR